MTSRIIVIGALSLAACEWGGGPGPGPGARSDAGGKLDAAGKKDAAGGDARAIDAAVVIDAAQTIDASAPPAHLLLTELVLIPDGSELIEVHNPTAATVDLSRYFLSNHGSYYKLPVAGQVIPFAHFIVKFPDGATIAPGGVVVVATQGAMPYMMTYGTLPDYSITDGTMTAVDVNNTPRLTDGGALVVLFRWDGTSGLVQDVDLMLAGIPNNTNVLDSKSGVTQNGMTYATDANTIPAQSSAPGIGQSTKRIRAEAGQETASGGNGITGHDETSEHTDLTWDTSFSAPTPGVVPVL